MRTTRTRFALTLLATCAWVVGATAIPAEAGKTPGVYSVSPAMCKTVGSNAVACKWRFGITGVRTGSLGAKTSEIQYGNSGTVSCTVNLVSSTRTSSTYETPWCTATRTDDDDYLATYSALYDSKGRIIGGNGEYHYWSTANCPTGHAFQPVLTGAMWDTAQADAVSLGGRLVWIDSAAKQACIAAFVGTGEYWIGATDSATEGTWSWVGGSVFCIGANPCEAQGSAYTNWYSGEPNNYKSFGFSPGEQCASLISDYTWNDAECDLSRAYIVEVPPAS